jgi:membrane protease YdiL (CAAX protease family)
MKKIWKAIGLIVLMLVIYVVAQGIVMLVLGIIHGVQWAAAAAASDTAPDLGMVTDELMRYLGTQTPLILLFAVLITLPLYYVIYRRRSQEVRAFVSFRGIHPAGIPVLVVLGLSLNFIVELLLTLLSQIGFLKQIFENYEQVTNVIFGGGFVLSLIAVGIVGPVFEELLFRGLVFGELRKITKVRLAIVLQALLFGIYHMNAVQGTYAFLIGLLLGFIYYRSNSIIVPMIVHVTINSSSVLVSQFVSEKWLNDWEGVVVVASFLLFILAGVFLLTHRSFRRAMDDSLYYSDHPPAVPPPEDGRQGS